jgi:hypothetical protein
MQKCGPPAQTTIAYRGPQARIFCYMRLAFLAGRRSCLVSGIARDGAMVSLMRYTFMAAEN